MLRRTREMCRSVKALLTTFYEPLKDVLAKEAV